jgi:hypothetical protein
MINDSFSTLERRQDEGFSKFSGGVGAGLLRSIMWTFFRFFLAPADSSFLSWLMIRHDWTIKAMTVASIETK